MALSLLLARNVASNPKPCGLGFWDQRGNRDHIKLSLGMVFVASWDQRVWLTSVSVVGAFMCRSSVEARGKLI